MDSPALLVSFHLTDLLSCTTCSPESTHKLTQAQIKFMSEAQLKRGCFTMTARCNLDGLFLRDPKSYLAGSVRHSDASVTLTAVEL